DGGLERVGERLDDLLELLGRTDTAATGDDDVRLGELRAVAADDRAARGDLGGVLGVRDLDVHDLACTGGRRGLDSTRAQRVDGRLTRDGGLDGEGATEDRVDGRAVGLDLDDVAEDAGAGAGRETSRDLLALERGGQDRSDLDGHDRAGTGGRRWLDSTRAQRVDGRLTRDGGLGCEGASEDRVDGRAVGLDLDDVAEDAGAGAGRETSRDLLALERGGQD